MRKSQTASHWGPWKFRPSTAYVYSPRILAFQSWVPGHRWLNPVLCLDAMHRLGKWAPGLDSIIARVERVWKLWDRFQFLFQFCSGNLCPRTWARWIASRSGPVRVTGMGEVRACTPLGLWRKATSSSRPLLPETRWDSLHIKMICNKFAESSVINMYT